MSFKEFMKKVLGIKRASTVVNSNQQLSTAINSNQQQSTVDGGYNIRDLQYARRMGQIEQMAADLALIKEKITGLDIKFDLRVPDKVLTEKRFQDELESNDEFFKELDSIRKSIDELKIFISNQQLSTAINSNQQLSTVVNSNQQLSTAINSNQQLAILEKIRKSADSLEQSMREKEILKQLNGNKLSSEEIGDLLGISRSRANQILIEMEKKGLVYRIKYGKKILWGKQNLQ